jgi:hypothetical protein
VSLVDWGYSPQDLGMDDDDRHDPHEAETPEPCRGCGSIHCDSECAAYREWLTVAWLAVDAAHGGDADG